MLGATLQHYWLETLAAFAWRSFRQKKWRKEESHCLLANARTETCSEKIRASMHNRTLGARKHALTDLVKFVVHVMLVCSLARRYCMTNLIPCVLCIIILSQIHQSLTCSSAWALAHLFPSRKPFISAIHIFCFPHSSYDTSVYLPWVPRNLIISDILQALIIASSDEVFK